MLNGYGIGIGILNDNVVNNYARLGCDEKARMHLNGLVEPWGHVAHNQRDSMAWKESLSTYTHIGGGTKRNRDEMNIRALLLRM